MDLGIRGRTALVTAGSKGLGFGSALALAEEGCNVVISARGEEALRGAEERLASTGAAVVSIAADVTDPDTPAQLVAAAVERFGAVDIVVANAGGPPPARSLDLDDEAIFKALNDNFVASARLVREAVPHMRSRGWGRVACITSSSIKEPIPTLSASNTARTALWAWAKTAATDLSADGITLNLVCPGLHDTDRMRQLGYTGGSTTVRAGDALDFGKVVAFMCSEPTAFVTGSTVLVDGGAAHGLV